ncbi:DUF6542 domain-containing protein [Kitasatospora sp. NPDC004723]|uniref:DUF6542 domain-containing protein n=1 Tax=Kitasatospora sp. NPDC004723 TaxID=3154288 RepID=UPI0033A0765C
MGSRRTPDRRAGARRSGGALPVLLAAVGLPLLGAVAGELTGSGGGALFAAGAVLGSGVAAALCGRAGRWWVVMAAPPVVLAARAGTAYLADREGLQGKALASAAVRWVVGAFPVMAWAVAVALLVVVVRVVLDRRARRGRRSADRRRAAGTREPETSDSAKDGTAKHGTAKNDSATPDTVTGGTRTGRTPTPTRRSHRG